jgi:hypothetical protein
MWIIFTPYFRLYDRNSGNSYDTSAVLPHDLFPKDSP